ncbi:MAG TPA: hypothetical protein VH116_11520 [Gemmatimonadales bacterium]|nr:hypothetical protein [Gemmatimonadales bacterium]
MTGPRALGVVVLAVVAAAGSGAAGLAAQDSQYGIRGLGTPGRWESVRARSTGGAFGPFDAVSPLMEASLADLDHITAGAMAGASYRTVDAGGTSSALRATRFPLLALGGPVSARLVLGGGFTTYLDRSWGVTSRDSAVLRGVNQRYTDSLTSDGSVADLRLALAGRVGPRLALGGAVHLLAGSTRVTAQRRFDDTTYHVTQQIDEVRYDGFGVSGSALLTVVPGLRLAAWARSDNRLRARVGGATVAENDLPRMAGGGVRFAPSPTARFAVAAAWRSWSRAGAGAFNTWNWSAGAELGGQAPFRFGVRGGQLPFGPGTTPPTEFAVAAGLGRLFSAGHGLIDLGVERLRRQGGGLTEQVWTLLVGITIRP